MAQSGTLGSSSSSSTLGKHPRHPKSSDTANKHIKRRLPRMSAAIEAKDKELENFREGQFSDSMHHTRQNKYKTENDSLCSDIEVLRKQVLKTQEDLDRTTRNRNELEYEIQGPRTTLRKNSTTMETQGVDLGTYKTSLSRLEGKYNDVVTQLDEAQIDRLNGEQRPSRPLQRLKQSVTASNCYSTIRLVPVSYCSANVTSIEQKQSDCEHPGPPKTPSARLRSEMAASQQSIDSLRRHLDASTPFVREPPNLFRASSEPTRGMQPPANLPSYSAANVGTSTVGQREWVWY